MNIDLQGNAPRNYHIVIEDRDGDEIYDEWIFDTQMSEIAYILDLELDN
jgi:hypothetical protein